MYISGKYTTIISVYTYIATSVVFSLLHCIYF